jgi:hypothetical protein
VEQDLAVARVDQGVVRHPDQGEQEQRENEPRGPASELVDQLEPDDFQPLHRGDAVHAPSHCSPGQARRVTCTGNLLSDWATDAKHFSL